MVTNKDFATPIAPTWCPGCGLYGIKAMIVQALVELNISPEQLVITYDVGCNGNGADKIRSYAFKSLHGRAIPPAIGIKYANHDLHVITIIGDGGLFWEGAAHWISTAQRNEDITVIVADNQIYGLTTGQSSGTTPKGTQTVSQPNGTKDEPLNPLLVSLSSGATFVSRGYVGKPLHLKEVIKKAILHKGFSFVDVLSQCITWTKKDMNSYYNDVTYDLASSPKTNTTDLMAALSLANQTEKLPIGVFYNVKKETLTEKYPLLSKQALINSKVNTNISDLLEEFK